MDKKLCPICDEKLTLGIGSALEDGAHEECLFCWRGCYSRFWCADGTTVFVGGEEFGSNRDLEMALAISRARCARVEQRLSDVLKIKVRILDKILSDLAPSAVEHYLERSGLEVLGRKRAGAVWRSAQYGIVYVSLDNECHNYGSHVHRLVEDLARVENRSEMAVYLDILDGAGREGQA